MSDDPHRPARPAWLLLSVALLILAASTGYGALRYPNLPERFPVHWNAAGLPDGYAEKGIGSAFSGIFVGFGVVLLFVLVGLLLGRTARSRGARSVPYLAATQRSLGVISIGLALVFWLVSQQIWAATGNATNPLLLILLVVLAIAIAAIFANRQYRAELAKLPARGADQPAPDPREDERFWIAGFIYNNPHDRATLVPKRSGLGLTVNWARSGGKATLLGLLAIPVMGILLAVWAALPH